MILVLWFLLLFHLLIVARWAWGAVEIRRTPVFDMQLTPVPDRVPQPNDPTLTVVIAAHNEADNIADCLNRLREQSGYAILQIIVVNDRSSDATGDIVRRIARDDQRIELVEVQTLPDGWIGKTHALSRGADRARGDYMLFVDGDVELKPGAISAVMDKAGRDGIDFLTLWPRLGLRSLADRILVPAAGWMLSFWAWVSIGSGIATRRISGSPVMGNGQFLLIRRSSYDRIGGHDAVRAELAEDQVLANNAHSADLKSWVGLGAGLYVASRHSTFSRCGHGLARVIIGSLGTPWKVLLSTQIVLGGCVAPFWIGPLALGLLAAGADPVLASAWALSAAAHIAAMFCTLRRLFDFTMEERGSLWWFPIGCLGTVYLLIWALFIMTGRRTIRWGATRYTVRGSRVLAPASDAG